MVGPLRVLYLFLMKDRYRSWLGLADPVGSFNFWEKSKRTTAASSNNTPTLGTCILFRVSAATLSLASSVDANRLLRARNVSFQFLMLRFLLVSLNRIPYF